MGGPWAPEGLTWVRLNTDPAVQPHVHAVLTPDVCGTAPLQKLGSEPLWGWAFGLCSFSGRKQDRPGSACPAGTGG